MYGKVYIAESENPTEGHACEDTHKIVGISSKSTHLYDCSED